MGFMLAAVTASAEAEQFQIVVHPTTQGANISRKALTAIFTGRALRWGDQTKVQPVDQSVRAPVRHIFTSQVLGMSLGELQLHWRRQMTKRRVHPPPTRSSDEDVLAFVAATTGAVGYVSTGVAIPDGVRVVALVD
jgi:ABC-type phosphate transport system substrate-binding protein